MTRLFSWLAVCGFLVASSILLPASSDARQGGSESSGAGGFKNPMDGNAEAIQSGKVNYEARCASCHGADAKGTERGSDLTGVWAAGETDQQLAQAVRRGVPNTLLRHSFGPDSDVWAVLAYLKTLSVASPQSPAQGNANNGKSIFVGRCGSCHEVDGVGGNLGPNLSQVGAARSRPFLAEKIRHSSSYIMDEYSGGNVVDGYQPVTLVTLDGKKIRGVKKNEDAFSIQIMDMQQRLQGHLKANLREVVNETKSLMPDFGSNVLSDQDLEDLLTYLGTLRDTKVGRP